MTPDTSPGLPRLVSEDQVRDIIIEYPSGVKLRLGCLTVEAASRLLRELGQAPDPEAGAALPSVEEVQVFLEAEARLKPVKTSQVHVHFLGRRYHSRKSDKPVYNAMRYRLDRARQAINDSPDSECIVALAEDGSGEDAWFVTTKGGS